MYHLVRPPRFNANVVCQQMAVLDEVLVANCLHSIAEMPEADTTHGTEAVIRKIDLVKATRMGAFKSLPVGVQKLATCCFVPTDIAPARL